MSPAQTVTVPLFVMKSALPFKIYAKLYERCASFVKSFTVSAATVYFAVFICVMHGEKAGISNTSNDRIGLLFDIIISFIRFVNMLYLP